MAELWGLREGLLIAKKRMLKNIEVETDSLTMAKALNKGLEENHPLELLVLECRSLVEEVNVVAVNHVYWEAKKCADKFAELGRSAVSGVTELINPPPVMVELLRQDAEGVVWTRMKGGFKRVR